MNDMTKSGLRNILLSLIYLIILNCASIKAPPGGPVDETPPEILNVDPPSGTINLKQQRITIEFSEYMDDNSFKNNITVFPRLEKSLEYKFKGNKIILKLPAQLDSNRTYVIQLNRNVKDEHGVPLAKSVQLAYSVGKTISKGTIKGNIYGTEKGTLHLWKTDDIQNDSVFATIPDYVTDANDFGNYSFEYLAPGSYQILAVESNSKDLPLNIERTEYGMYWENGVTLVENDTLANINMRMWKEPQNLKLVRGEWSNYNWGTLYFNNELNDSLSLNMRLLQNENEIDFNYFLDATDSKKLVVSAKDSLNSKSIMVNIDSLLFNDKILLDSAVIEIQIPQEPDTSFLQIINSKSDFSIIPNDINGDQIDLIFSKPVTLAADSISLPHLFDKDSSNIPIIIEQKNPMYLKIHPVETWKENSRYKLFINRDGVLTKYGKGLKDSLQIINISTKTSMGYGGVIGTTINNKPDDLLVELFSVKNSSLSHIADVNSQSQFEFKMIPEGDYSLCFFKDSNNDMKYNFGKAYQLKPSEWFYFYPDTFEIRANWDTELNPINLPEYR